MAVCMHTPQKPSNLVFNILPLNVLNVIMILRPASGHQIEVVIVVTSMQGLIQILLEILD